MQAETIEQFLIELEQAIDDRLGQEFVYRRDAFARLVADHLTEDGSLEDLEVCYYTAPFGRSRIEVGGYALNDDGRILDLVVALYGHHGETVPRDQITKRFRWAVNFAAACRDGLHQQLDESTAERDMALRVHEQWPQIAKIRVFAFTDGRSTLTELGADDLDGTPVVLDLWDAERLRRLATSGRRSEPITVDFQQLGGPLLCLPAQDGESGYQCLMAILPGQLLADMYEEHGSKLLERNVRAFLQTRGKVNKAINETIKKNPGMFLAYNNGISATATGVKLDEGTDGTYIAELHDLQIVNGGQTTASLHHAAMKDKADLSLVRVPAKITVVDPGQLDDLVPKISRFANSQNTINEADFEASSPFHRELQALSRSVWAPAADGTTRQTRWYYERVRGQYQVDRARRGTGAAQRAFDAENPRNQRFTKTDAARYEMTFLLQPHVVSLGAQKAFQHWTVNVVANRESLPDAEYFNNLVAKRIFFEQGRSEIRKQFPPGAGYLANVTTYTLARLSTSIDLPSALSTIWRAQGLPEELRASIRDLSWKVRELLLDAPGSGNVTEWCKKEACWESVRSLRWTSPPP
ncbi:AIPR family protein [Nonomuraea wenchangensis]